MPIFLSLFLLLSRSTLLSTLWNIWSSFWFYCAMFDYYILPYACLLITTPLGFLRNCFLRFTWYLEKHVTVEFFIYGIFLPFAYIPSILFNHAGRYTLPYSKCGGPRRRHRPHRSKGAHLARYFSNLRSTTTVITTSKGDYRNSNLTRNRSTAPNDASHLPMHQWLLLMIIDNLLQCCFSSNASQLTILMLIVLIKVLTKILASHQSGYQRSLTDASHHAQSTGLSADEQVAQLIKKNPSLSLDLFLFESKMYWKDILTPSPTTINFPSTSIDSFLHSFNVIDHF
jgi:hypothetical protein